GSSNLLEIAQIIPIVTYLCISSFNLNIAKITDIIVKRFQSFDYACIPNSARTHIHTAATLPKIHRHTDHGYMFIHVRNLPFFIVTKNRAKTQPKNYKSLPNIYVNYRTFDFMNILSTRVS